MKKFISGALLLTALALLGIFGWNFYGDYSEQRASDTQTQMKPDTPNISGEEANPSSESLPLMDFTALKAKNEEIITWLTIDGLGIDYPVVQAADNQYYINHTAEKKRNRLGALFLDFRSQKDFSDFYNVVYGHNMASGKMFGRLSQMKNRENFERITSGILYTPAKTHRLEIFAVVVTGPRSDFYRYIFPDTTSREEHLRMTKKYAKYYRDIGVTSKDKLIALSTCSYEFQDARTLLIARLAG